MSNTTYILKVPAVGEITREEFRADDSLKQLQKAVGGYIERVPYNFGSGIDCFCNEDGTIKIEHGPFNFGCGIDRFCNEDGTIKGDVLVVNTAIADIVGMPIIGDAVFAAHDEEGETIGLTAEQCAELERRLTMRRREPEQEAESRNGEAEAVRNAVGCESVP